MSHTYASINSEGNQGNGNFKYVEEDVHLRLHAYWGGEKRGRCTSLSIDRGHNYEAGSEWDNNINIDKHGAIFLINQLTKWLAGEEGDDDYSTHEEFTVQTKEKEIES